MKKTYFLYFTIIAAFAGSCKKFVQIDPPVNQVTSDKVFINDATATAAVTGIYSDMMGNSSLFSSSYTTLYTGMYSDELYYYSGGNNDEFVRNQLTQANHPLLSSGFWLPAYKYIYAANFAGEKLAASNSVSSEIKTRLTGECRFIRAFCYFHLVNLFGPVPLVLHSDYHESSILPGAAISDIYDQMILDLKEAKTLLPSNYATAERTRPNKWAAAALLARVYQYKKDWAASRSEADEVIKSGLYALPSNLSNVFLKNSTEAIWQLQPVNPTWNTWEGFSILPSTAASLPTYLVTSSLLNTFEMGDNRKTSWINSRVFAGATVYYPYKYKVYGNGAPITEYYSVLRLAEQYLIRAEARAYNNDLSGALDDLNTIHMRAGLSSINLSDQKAIIDTILHERRVEFCFEWGHRWFDLKRNNLASTVLGPLKGSTWQPTDTLWPIPYTEINANPRLTQNPGY